MASKKSKAKRRADNSEKAARSTRPTKDSTDATKDRRQIIIKSLNEAKKKGDSDRCARLTSLLQNDDNSLNTMAQTDWDDVMDVDSEGTPESGEGGFGVKNTEEDALSVVDEEEEEEDEDEDDNTNGDRHSNESGEGSNSTKKIPKDDETEEGSGSKKRKKVSILESIEDNEADSLFLSDSETKIHHDDESAKYIDEEYGRPLHTNPGVTNNKNVKSVGWYGDRSVAFINMHGKKSHARYRIEHDAYPIEYEKSLPGDENISNMKNRMGDKKDDDGKPMYKKRHILHIWAVAWGTGRNASEDDLNAINPKYVTNWRRVPTRVRIEWNVPDSKTNKNKRTWETRSVLRRCYGRKNADEIIFKAAVEAEARFAMATFDERRAGSRSPSAALVQESVDRYRDQSMDASPRRSSRSLTPSKTARSSMGARSPTPDDDDDGDDDDYEWITPSRPLRSSMRARPPTLDDDHLKHAMAEFLTSFSELLGKHKDFAHLTPHQQGQLTAAWGAHKDSLEGSRALVASRA